MRTQLRGIKGYGRYVDDFLVFSDDKKRLADLRRQVIDFLRRLRLRLHPTKSVIFPVAQGVRFLGYRVFGTHRLLAQENVWRFRRRLRKMQRRYARYEMGLDGARQRIMSWVGHARQADTYRLRRRLFREHPFRRAATV